MSNVAERACCLRRKRARSFALPFSPKGLFEPVQFFV